MWVPLTFVRAPPILIRSGDDPLMKILACCPVHKWLLWYSPFISGEPYSRADHPLLIRLGHPLLIVHPLLVDDDGQDAQ